MIRFVFLFNYPRGVSPADGEKWYLGKHLEDVKKVPGVRRYTSYQRVDPPDTIQPVMGPKEDQYERRSELWFDNYRAWEASRHLWVAAKEGEAGFRLFDCVFAPVEEEYDLLRDCPPQHIKFIANPIQWRGGKPPDIEETEDFFVYSYLVARRPDVSIYWQDEGYMGHHTREGKQMPGMKHYRTWMAAKVPEQPAGSLLKLQRWYRLTELGMCFSNFYNTMLNPQIGVLFTGYALPPPPAGTPPPAPGRGNLFIDLKAPQELIKLT